MGGHLIGKFLLKVTLSNGEVAYLMDIHEGSFQTTRNPEAAARFLTAAGAKKYYYSMYHLPYYDDPSVYISDGFVIKSDHL